MLSFLLSSIAVFGEEQTIYLKNGQILRGEVIHQTATSIQIKITDGKIRQLNKIEIQRVSYKEPTTKELKDSEDKLKQKTQEPQPPIVEPSPQEPPKKNVTNFQLDQTKRHDLEIFGGIGYGYYKPDSETFLLRMQNTLNLLTASNPTITEKPSYKAGLSNHYGLTYTYRRLSGSFSGSNFRSDTTLNTLTINSANEFNTTNGTFPEKQTTIKADISYLAFTNSRFDLRPSVGYFQFWGNTDDTNTSLKAYSSSGLYLYGNYFFQVFEQMKGPSLGLKSTIRTGERIENRIELYYLSLKGNQDNTIHATVFPDSSSAFYGEVAQKSAWSAKGFQLSYKFVYRITPVFSLWAGISAYEWKYNLDQTSNEIRYAFDSSTPRAPGDALLNDLLQTAIGKGATSVSKSNSLDFGVMYRLDFLRQ
ncbi:OprO/OprP family phosphate-selective porin [Leptospira hartskeerlii]|uniref:OprO/OprP family phosphate-selective porin n=1 Tax=Leptospira hartskeerlii TaxID=2023177 RepID=UPI001FAEDCA8|nr:OprO/OprP family phosphate-selective porin [Leptospira hartskeerlii]